MENLVMITNWPTKKLTDLCKLERGTEPGSDSYVKDLVGTIPFLRVGDLTGKVDAKRFVKKSNNNLQVVNKNETLITFDGTPGIVVRGFSGAIASGIRVIRNLKPEINGDFLFYYLKTPMVQKMIKAYSKGVTIIHASAAIPYIKIPLPSVLIQRKIVERLDATKKAQELNNKQIELAEELFQSLLHRELDPKGKNWEGRFLKDILVKIQNGTTAKQNQEGRGYPVTRIETIQNSQIDPLRIRHAELSQEEFEKYRLNLGDILFSHINSEELIGKVAIFENQIENLILGMNLLVLRPQKTLVIPHYLYFYFLTQDARTQIARNAKRAVNQASINQAQLARFKVPTSSLGVQKQIVEKLSAVQDYKKKLLEQKAKLQELFESVLNKSMKGQL